MFVKNISGDRLRELRQSRNLSLKDVADALGTSKSTIGNIERGTKPASLEMVIKLADFFDVSLDYLVGRSDNPRRR
ncbi:MAG: helix-turn-helix domain-containing protein [Firmicutes bacterium]|nr:helix-turn-helix domain-containing protein [Bacillota bacterium]